MKIKKIIVLAISLCLVGCKGDDIREFRHSGYTFNNESFSCKEVEKVKFLYDNFLVSENNDIYYISLDLPYSNKSNCRLINSNEKMQSIYGEEAFKSFNNIIYSFDFKNYTDFPIMNNSNNIIETLLNDNTNLKIINNDNHYYILKNDGNIYDYVIEQNENIISIISNALIYSSNNLDGKIIDFYYSQQMPLNYIKTNTTYYTFKPINEDCKKYADIECNYELKKDDLLNKYSKEIYAYNGKKVILSNGKILDNSIN